MIRLLVTPGDGDPFEVTVPGAVLLEWEAKNGKALEDAAESRRHAWAFELAHATLVARGLPGSEMTFDGWTKTVDWVQSQPDSIEQTLVGWTIDMSPEAIELVAERLTAIAASKRTVAGFEAEIAPPADPTGGEPDRSPADSPA